MRFRTLLASAVAFAALVAPAATPAPATPAPQKAKVDKSKLPRVAVLSFPVAPGAWSGWRHGGWGHEEAHIGDVLRDLFVTSLGEKGRGKLRLVERERLQEIRGELEFQQSGEVDTNTVQKLGKLLGVKYMITGKVTRFAYKDTKVNSGWGVGALVGKVTGSGLAGGIAGDMQMGKASFTGRLDVRLIEVETGEILGTFKDEGSTSDMSVKIAGTGKEVEYDEEMVNKIFEPIVDKMAPKIIRSMGLANSESEE